MEVNLKKLLLTFMLLSLPAQALEKNYALPWCKANGGISEYELQDKTRVDCLTPEYAVEFEFAHKWAESIGQSLYYSKMTGRKPAIALIMSRGDEKYFNRIIKASDGEITIFRIRKGI